LITPKIIFFLKNVVYNLSKLHYHIVISLIITNKGCLAKVVHELRLS